MMKQEDGTQGRGVSKVSKEADTMPRDKERRKKQTQKELRNDIERKGGGIHRGTICAVPRECVQPGLSTFLRVHRRHKVFDNYAAYFSSSIVDCKH